MDVMTSKIDHNKAFNSLAGQSPTAGKPQDEDQGEDQEQSDDQEQGDDQEQYQEPEQDELISSDEIAELEQQLMKDGYTFNEADKLIQSHIDDLKKMHKKLHDSGQLKDFLEKEDQGEDEGQDQGEGEDQGEDQDQDQATDEESPNQASPGKSNDVLSHYMKMHEQSQKHIHSMLQSLSGSKTNEKNPK